MHAEVLVRRGVRRWILRQLGTDPPQRQQQQQQQQQASTPRPLLSSSITSSSTTSSSTTSSSTTSDDGSSEPLPEPVLVPAEGINTTWRWNDQYELSLYVSRVPCGSASAALLPEDEALLSVGLPGPHASPSALRGRTDLSRRDRVRTKPGRTDAPVATSMSCSDKLALWNVVGLQGSLGSALIPEPIRYAHLVIGLDGLSTADSAKVSQARQDTLVQHVHRALVERVEGFLPGPQPTVHATTIPFVHSKDLVDRVPGGPLYACPDSMSFVPGAGITKISPLGIKAGASAKRPPNLSVGDPGTFPPQRRAPLSKLDWFIEYRTTLARLLPSSSSSFSSSSETSQHETYYEAKHTEGSEGTRNYRVRKAQARGSQESGVQALQVFVRLHQVNAVKACASTALDVPTGAESSSDEPAPLAGWLVSGPLCEQFTL